MSLIHLYRETTERTWNNAQRDAREIAADVVWAARATREGRSRAEVYMAISVVLFLKAEDVGECALGWCLQNMAEEAADTAARLRWAPTKTKH